MAKDQGSQSVVDNGEDGVIARLDLGESALLLTQDRVIHEERGPLAERTREIPVSNLTGIATGLEGSWWLLGSGVLVGLLFFLGLMGVPYAEGAQGWAIAANAFTGVVMLALFAAFFVVKVGWIEISAAGTRIQASKHGAAPGSMAPFVESTLDAWERSREQA